MEKINIAIDGYSSCGKSTLARELAVELGYRFIDTGAMYRAVTLHALNKGYISASDLDKESLINSLDQLDIDFSYNEERQASDIILNGENIEGAIREMKVSNAVSRVATVKGVRQRMVAMQQHMGESKGVVMDGRDIGTVVFPDAELKIFMTASLEVRTKRRYDELVSKGLKPSLGEVRKNLVARDHLDTSRDEDPLRQAEDARVLDNSDLTREEQLQLSLSWVKELI